jgi:hypothetical protein
MAFMGLIGLGTALIVIKTAFTNTDRFERKRKLVANSLVRETTESE